MRGEGGKNYALFFGPGEDFATEPPSEKEQKEHSNLWRHIRPTRRAHFRVGKRRCDTAQVVAEVSRDGTLDLAGMQLPATRGLYELLVSSVACSPAVSRTLTDGDVNAELA